MGVNMVYVAYKYCMSSKCVVPCVHEQMQTYGPVMPVHTAKLTNLRLRGLAGLQAAGGSFPGQHMV